MHPSTPDASSPSPVTVREFDWCGFLACLTKIRRSRWVEADGPDSGCGVDYFYQTRNGDTSAYINVDQEHISVSVDDETLFSDSVDKIPARFVTSS